MPNVLEVTKDTIMQFQRVQKCMLLAKKENAAETYAELKTD